MGLKCQLPRVNGTRCRAPAAALPAAPRGPSPPLPKRGVIQSQGLPGPSRAVQQLPAPGEKAKSVRKRLPAALKGRGAARPAAGAVGCCPRPPRPRPLTGGGTGPPPGLQGARQARPVPPEGGRRHARAVPRPRPSPAHPTSRRPIGCAGCCRPVGGGGGGGAMADRLTQLQDAVNSVRRALTSSPPMSVVLLTGGEGRQGRPWVASPPASAASAAAPGPGRCACEGVRSLSPRSPARSPERWQPPGRGASPLAVTGCEGVLPPNAGARVGCCVGSTGMRNKVEIVLAVT